MCDKKNKFNSFLAAGMLIYGLTLLLSETGWIVHSVKLSLLILAIVLDFIGLFQIFKKVH